MNRKPALFALCLLGTQLPSSADTFKLKDGTTLEGTVLSDSGDNYVLEILVTKSIKDERTIPKSDVVKIIREEPDLKAYEEIAKLVPSAEMLSADDYAQNINAVNKFLKTYPKSGKVKKAKDILDTLTSESAQVAAGSVKIGGRMITPSEYQANAYDLDARVQEAKIRQFVSNNQFLPALRLFADFDKEFRNTLSYGALISLMKQVIQAQVDEARQSLLTLDARTKQRALGIERMALNSRKATEAAIKAQDSDIEALYKAEKDARLNWPTTSPFHKASLDDTVKFGEAELKRLEDVKTILGLDGGKAYRELWSAIKNSTNATTVNEALTNAKAAGVPAKYMAPLEQAAKDVK